MPRRPYVAREKIHQNLSQGHRVWSQLRRETGLSEAALSTNLARLMKENLVRKTVDGYTLSFIGLVRYLFERFGDRAFGRKEIEQVVDRYAVITGFPLFTEKPFLEEWLGSEYYDLILSSSVVTHQQLLSQSQVPRVLYAKAIGSIERGEKVVVSGIQLPSPEEEEAEWMRVYTLWFFRLITMKPGREIKPPSNVRIRDLIEQTFKKETQLREDGLLELENAKRKLLD